MTKKKTKETVITWHYDEDPISPEEFIRRITPLVCDPVHTLRDCDGDMYMSDFQKLCEAANRLTFAFHRA